MSHLHVGDPDRVVEEAHKVNRNECARSSFREHAGIDQKFLRKESHSEITYVDLVELEMKRHFRSHSWPFSRFRWAIDPRPRKSKPEFRIECHTHVGTETIIVRRQSVYPLKAFEFITVSMQQGGVVRSNFAGGSQLGVVHCRGL